LDTGAFRDNVRAWFAHPVAGVVVGGSTGESPFLSVDELAELVSIARDEAGSRHVVAGAGAESTRDTIQRTLAVAERGAEAVLVRPPSYYRAQMTSEVLREHFLALADRSPVPVILYHVPKFVPVDLVPDLVGELARHENVVGIKDSSGDIKNLGALADACEGRANVLVGSGSHLYSALELGATGGIVAVGMLAPAMTCELYEAFGAGRTMTAGRLQERIGPLNKVVVGTHGVPGIKYALERLGLRGGHSRRPLFPLREKAAAEVDAALVRAGLLEVPAAARGASDGEGD
jgi:4-hydroxy-2-oxoglutarate aldolase